MTYAPNANKQTAQADLRTSIDNFEVDVPQLTISEKDIDNLDSKIELSPAELFILLENIQ